MISIKKTIRRLVRWAGFDITRVQRDDIGNVDSSSIGNDPFVDMPYFLAEQKEPVIFDVGANIGLSVDRFMKVLPTSVIHSFEPSPTTYEKLREHCNGMPSVKTWNYGVGSEEGTLALQENEYPVMSSFLAPSELAWSKVVRTTDAQVIKLDSFAKEQGIEFIDILKSDTQGYDFEVFKGANQLMKENRIGLIYFEIILSDMYKELPKFHDAFRYLYENNFDLVSFYDSYFQNELLSWTDALFINRNFNLNRIKQGGVGNSDSSGERGRLSRKKSHSLEIRRDQSTD